MRSDEVAPPGVDPTRPSVARVYDYMLGGKDNFAVDREVAALALKIAPDAPQSGRANRAFLRKAVRCMMREAGIRQFLDIGSGLPTVGNTHEVAHSVDPAARVVYLDNDPMALAHGRALLADSRTTIVVQGDLRQTDEILNHPEICRHLDFSQPIGLLLFGILHHINDEEDPAGIAARLRDALAPGSCLAISHFSDPGEAYPELSAKVRDAEELFRRTMGSGRWRTHPEILAYFGSFELLEPGLVPVADWRPEPGEAFDLEEYTHHSCCGAVARKR